MLTQHSAVKVYVQKHHINLSSWSTWAERLTARWIFLSTSIAALSFLLGLSSRSPTSGVFTDTVACRQNLSTLDRIHLFTCKIGFPRLLSSTSDQNGPAKTSHCLIYIFDFQIELKKLESSILNISEGWVHTRAY